MWTVTAITGDVQEVPPSAWTVSTVSGGGSSTNASAWQITAIEGSGTSSAAANRWAIAAIGGTGETAATQLVQPIYMYRIGGWLPVDLHIYIDGHWVRLLSPQAIGDTHPSPFTFPGPNLYPQDPANFTAPSAGLYPGASTYPTGVSA